MISNKKHVRRALWERVFKYPSSKSKFAVTVCTVLAILALAVLVLIYVFGVSLDWDKWVSLVELLVQIATFMLAVFAAYYALRQLDETRFNGLDEAGSTAMRRTKYLRAYEKWKEAFQIRADAMLFASMCEALLLHGDYEVLDQYLDIEIEKGKLFQEPSEKVLLFYLKAMRHLFQENQGAAKDSIRQIIALSAHNKEWSFDDLQSSVPYLSLEGECKTIADNVIAFLTEKMPASQREAFVGGRFAAPQSATESSSVAVASSPVFDASSQ